jgi:hypothetical protein
VLLALLGGAAAVALPRIADERESDREQAARVEARERAEFLAYVDREQRPRRGEGRADPGGGAGAARRVALRGALLADARAGIAEDAGQRRDEKILGTECQPFPRSTAELQPEADLSRPAAAYSCVAVTARFGSEDQAGGKGIIGIQFRLVVDFARGRYAWCRIVPLGDKDRLTKPLPDACRLAPAGS